MRKSNKNISNERALSLIKSPIMTEKSTNLNQFNKYSFVVSKDSNSKYIKIYFVISFSYVTLYVVVLE